MYYEYLTLHTNIGNTLSATSTPSWEATPSRPLGDGGDAYRPDVATE